MQILFHDLTNVKFDSWFTEVIEQNEPNEWCRGGRLRYSGEEKENVIKRAAFVQWHPSYSGITRELQIHKSRHLANELLSVLDRSAVGLFCRPTFINGHNRTYPHFLQPPALVKEACKIIIKILPFLHRTNDNPYPLSYVTCVNLSIRCVFLYRQYLCNRVARFRNTNTVIEWMHALIKAVMQNAREASLFLDYNHR